MKKFLLPAIAASLLSCSFVSAVAGAPQGVFKYVSPLPGARYVMPRSRLLFRPGGRLEGAGSSWTSSLKVSGSESGTVDGGWSVSDDRSTFIFTPGREFREGETVKVSLDLETHEGRIIYGHRFEVASRIPRCEPEPEELPEPGIGSDLNGRSGSADGAPGGSRGAGKRPDEGIDYALPSDMAVPEIIEYDDPAPGRIFAANLSRGKNSSLSTYLMILENDGTPCFFRRMPGSAYDFKKQDNGLLTYIVSKPGVNCFYTMDNTYTVVDSYTAVGGYEVDLHEFLMTEDGHALLIADDPEIIDMSQLVAGGDTAALVIGNVIQEFDESKNLVFQWRTRDFYDITDANIDLTAHRIRYAHINAIEIDHDGNILISSRHQSEITKIDRETGDMIWRMGGNNNQFDLVGDTQWFSRQHDVRRLDNGHMTLFDNGNLNTPQETRIVEYDVDEDDLVATLVWEYRHAPPLYCSAMGSARRLPGGNTIIGWGSKMTPNLTEVRPDGSVALEMDLAGSRSYRVFKERWDGVAAEPYAWADTTGGRFMLYFTKFGDPGVAGYYVYRGSSPSPARKAYVTSGHSVRIRGFEEGEPVCLRVRSFDQSGALSPYSNEVTIEPEFTDSPDTTEALVDLSPSTLNLDSEGRWITARIEFPAGSALSAADIDGTCVMMGDALLCEGGSQGPAGNKLMFKFDRASAASMLDPGEAVEIVVSGYAGEMAFEATDHIRVIKHDSSASIGSGGDGNNGESRRGKTVSVRPRGIAESSLRNYPNPFNPLTTIYFTLTATSRVNVSIYDVRGRRIATLADGMLGEGTHEIEWDGRTASGRQAVSGVYFYRLATPAEVLTRKMLLLR